METLCAVISSSARLFVIRHFVTNPLSKFVVFAKKQFTINIH